MEVGEWSMSHFGIFFLSAQNVPVEICTVHKVLIRQYPLQVLRAVDVVSGAVYPDGSVGRLRVRRSDPVQPHRAAAWLHQQ